MFKINYKSDFTFILVIRDCEGNDIGFPPMDFDAQIWTNSKINAYYFGRRNGELINCKNEDDKIRVIVNDHQMRCGELQVEVTLHLPDSEFPDQERRIVTPDKLDITLVNLTDSTCYPSEVAGISFPMALVTSYDIAVKYGYEGTQEQFIQDLTSIKNAESVKEEIAIQTEEIKRVENELKTIEANTRLEAEKAEAFALDAADSAIGASNYANASSQSADASAQSANNARQHSEQAKTYSDTAQEYSESAKTYSESAKGYSEQASESKNNALNSANKAAESVSKCQEYVTTTEGIKSDVEGLKTATTTYVEGAKSEITTSITEHKAEMEVFSEQCSYRITTLNYGTNEETIQIANLEDATLTLTDVMVTNVATLYITTGSYIKEPIDLTNTPNISISGKAFATFDIVRSGSGTASVGLKFKVQ